MINGPDLTAANFETALARFLYMLQQRENACPGGIRPNTFTIERGKKNIRIVQENGPHRSCYAFVRISDGAILKSAGWVGPFIAKGGPDCPQTVRGSIYGDNPLDGTSIYGVIYIDRTKGGR